MAKEFTYEELANICHLQHDRIVNLELELKTKNTLCDIYYEKAKALEDEKEEAK